MTVNSKIENNAVIASVAKAITTPKKNGKTVVMLSPEVTLASVSGIAKGFQLQNDGVKMINTHLKPFHDSKVKLCKASEKTNPLFAYSNQVRTMFLDAFKGVTNPVSGKAYAKDYLEKRLYPAFMNAVNSGKPLNSMHDNASKKSASSKSEKTEADIKKDLIKALTSIYANSNSCSEVFEFLNNCVDEGSNFLESITEFLESEGIELE
jgi:hypothetical protein